MNCLRVTRAPVRREERGFALLVIFLIAAAVAFTMYQEMPRVAFESVRNKEQILMDRGNQYKRAIQVFYAVNKRYPQEIKDLENTNEKRFLRRRYIDPMTGKDEWRLVHTNGSFLTDSLVTKPPAQNANNGLPGAGQTPGGGPLGTNNMNSAPGTTGTTAANANQAVNPNDPSAAAGPAPLNAAAQARPSDRGVPTGPGFPQPRGVNGTAIGANPANFNPDDPSTWPPITLAPPAAQSGQTQQGLGQRPGQAAGFQQPQGGLGQLPGLGGGNPQPAALNNGNPLAANGLVAQVPDPSAQANAAATNLNQFPAPVDSPQQPQPQQTFNPPQPPNLGNAGFNPQNPAPAAPAAGAGQANPALPGSASTGGSSNPALASIGDSLTHPNQAAPTGPTGSPGIAGVASTFKGPSIKAYKERLKYQEWEFIYEPAANLPAGATPPGAPGQPGALGQPGAASQPGANPFGSPGQNPLGPNPSAPASGQTPSPGSNTNPFSQTNIFGPQTPGQ
jgi:hypothetical protein